MLEQILNIQDLVFYLIAAEAFLLCFLQVRTNYLLRRTLKVRMQKKENVKQLKEVVKKGESQIPVAKFEKPKMRMETVKKQEPAGEINTKEMAVLQEMMTEFFG